MKNKNLLPLLAVAAGGLYLANQNKSKESENRTNSLAFTDDSTFADEEALKEKFIEIVKSNNTELRALLRGWDGTKGDKGDQGIQGIQGIKGDKGDKGDQGIQGLQGIQGVQGFKGENGSVLPTVSYSTTVNLANNNPVTITHNLNLSFPDRINVQLIGADTNNQNINNQNIYWFRVLNHTANSVQISLNVLSSDYYGNHKVIIVAGANQTQNFSNSLIVNGALEMGNLYGFNPNSWDIENTLTNGRKSAISKVTTGNRAYIPDVKIDNRKLYKFLLNYQTVGGSGTIYLQASIFDDQRNLVTKGSPTFDNVFTSHPLTNSSTMTKNFVTYFGGVGVLHMNFSEDTTQIAAYFYSPSAIFVKINQLVLQEVNLGEPVPYNLPWLPVGQTVFDPTTNKLGRYTGTTIVWSA